MDVYIICYVIWYTESIFFRSSHIQALESISCTLMHVKAEFPLLHQSFDRSTKLPSLRPLQCIRMWWPAGNFGESPNQTGDDSYDVHACHSPWTDHEQILSRLIGLENHSKPNDEINLQCNTDSQTAALQFQNLWWLLCSAGPKTVPGCFNDGWKWISHESVKDFLFAICQFGMHFHKTGTAGDTRFHSDFLKKMQKKYKKTPLLDSRNKDPATVPPCILSKRGPRYAAT